MQYLTAEEVADRLGVPLRKVQKMEEDGTLRSVKIAWKKFYDEFQISRIPGYHMSAPSLNHSQYLLALCEESTC